jgi:hypothetical protein
MEKECCELLCICCVCIDKNSCDSLCNCCNSSHLSARKKRQCELSCCYYHDSKFYYMNPYKIAPINLIPYTCCDCFSEPTKIKIDEWCCFDITTGPYYTTPLAPNQWESSLCENENFISYYCLQFNQYKRAKSETNNIDCCCCLLMMSIDCIPPFCCGSMCTNLATRIFLRKKYYITYQTEQTNICSDCLLVYFCSCCIVQQHEYFLAHVEQNLETYKKNKTQVIM